MRNFIIGGVLRQITAKLEGVCLVFSCRRSLDGTCRRRKSLYGPIIELDQPTYLNYAGHAFDREIRLLKKRLIVTSSADAGQVC